MLSVVHQPAVQGDLPMVLLDKIPGKRHMLPTGRRPLPSSLGAQ